MPRREPLDDYRGRRDPARTPEPSGDGEAPRGKLGAEGRPLFVIQHHTAQSEHWDLRLEHDGVLLSWAVPKGPSTDPRDKRLAVRTEDHPLDYADFEGVIPEGEYGAGEVIVWDAGPYEHITGSGEGEDDERLTVDQALAKGHVSVRLEGRKLQGGYALVHTKLGGDERNWLLVKMDDDDADARRKPTSTEPESVLTGRTVAQLGDDPAAGAGD